MLTADLRGVAGLKYDHPFDRRINATQQVGVGSHFSTQHGFDQKAQGPGTAVNIITQKGFARSYGFDQGKSNGRQLGFNKAGETLKLRAGTNQYEETLADGTIILYGVGGTVSELTTPGGITITRDNFNAELQIIRVPSQSHTGIGMGKISDVMGTTRNNPGQIRQIWSRTDGLLDIIEHTSISSRIQRYTINWYAPEAVGPYNAVTKLYTVTGTPVKHWDITTEDADYSLDDTPTHNGIENSFDRGKMVTYPSGGNIPNAIDIGPDGGKYGNRTGYTRRAIKLLDIVETRPGKTPQSPTLSYPMRWEQPDMYTLKLIKGSGDDAEICLKRRLGAKGGQVNSFLSGTGSHATRSPMMSLTYKSGSSAGQHIFSRGVTFDQTTPDGYITAAGGKQIDETVDTKYYFKGEHNPCNLDQAELVTREIYKRYEFGEVLIASESGYGSPDSQRTVHVYDTEPRSRTYGRILKQINADGSQTLLNHDNNGRVISRTEPWAGGGTRITRTTWSNLKGFEHRPATETIYIEQNRTRTQIGRTIWHYENTPALRRETSIQTGIGLSQPLTTVWEHYGPDTTQNGSSSPHAAGRLKKLVNPDGTCTLYEYHNTSQHRALYKIVATQCDPDGQPVSGLSGMQVSYIDDKGRTTASQAYAHMGTRTASASTNPELWYGSTPFKLISQHTYEHDYSHKTTKTTDYAGRTATTEWICKGPLSQTDENGITTTYAYNSAKQLETVTRASHTLDWPDTVVSHAYNATGQSTSRHTFTGPMRTSVHTTYDFAGRITSQTDEAGLVTTYAYSADGLTTTVTTATGATYITTRHPDGSVLAETGTGQQTRHHSYALTSQGLVTQTRLESPNGPLVSEIVADILGNPLIERQSGGDGTTLETLHTYNTLGRLVKTEQTGSPAQLIDYDTLGNITRTIETDGSGAERITSQNQSYCPTSEIPGTFIGEFIMQYGLNADAITWRKNAATRHQYTGGADITETTYKLVSDLETHKHDISITFDKYGQPIATVKLFKSATTGVPTVEFITYPQAVTTTVYRHTMLDLESIVTVDGLTVWHRDHADHVTRYEPSWSRLGTSVKATDGLGYTMGFTHTTRYDIAGRVISYTNATGDETTYEFDTQTGLLDSVTHPDLTETHYAYDHRGRKTVQNGDATHPVGYEYDEADRLVAMHTWREHDDSPATATADTTRWKYHAVTGLLLAKQYADGTEETYAYDAQSRLIGKTTPSGRRTWISYDQMTGKALSIAHAEADSPEPSGDYSDDVMSFTYDVWGNILTSRRASAGLRPVTYDTFGDVLTETVATGGLNATITSKRDSQGRNAGYELKLNGRVIQKADYAYDHAGRIEYITHNDSGSFRYMYQNGTGVSGRLCNILYPNGMIMDIQRDSNHRPEMLFYFSDEQYYFGRIYVRDARGRIEQELIIENGQEIMPGREHIYSPRGEIWSTTDWDHVNCWTYDYDHIGNPVYSGSDNEISRFFDQLNRITRIEDYPGALRPIVTFEPAFDADGNQTRLKSTTGNWNVTYGPDGRVSFLDGSAPRQGRVLVHHTYDAFARPLQVFCHRRKDEPDEQTTLSHFIHHGNQLIAVIETTEDASRIISERCFLWSPAEPEASRPLAMTIQAGSSETGTPGNSSSSASSGTSPLSGTWYYLNDHNKNVIGLTDEQGNISATYEYDPYGNLLLMSGSVAGLNPLRFSSEYYNDTTGLIDYLYRTYNPLDQRWIQRDPIAEQGGINLYGFVGNDPVNLVDVLGLNSNRKYQRYLRSYGWDNIDQYWEARERFSNNDKDVALYEPSDIYTRDLPHNEDIYFNYKPGDENKIHYGWYHATGQNVVAMPSQKEIDQLESEVNRVNQIQDPEGRPCYLVHIRKRPINSQGAKDLPWNYDRAILNSHSGLTPERGGYAAHLGRGEIVHSSELDPRVDVVGCHLSGKPDGKVAALWAFGVILGKLNNLKEKDCCCQVEKIILVTGRI